MKRRKKFDKIINFGGGALLLASLALASLGFSSWLVINSPSTSAAGEIEAATVVDGILFKDASLTTFSMCQDGILGVDDNGNLDGTVVDSANIIAKFTIRKTACENLGYLKDGNVLTIKTTLTSQPSSSTNSFLDYVTEIPVVALSPSGESSTPELNSDSTKSSLIYSLDVTLGNDETELTLTYAVDFPSNSDIGSTTSYVPYYNTNLKFAFNVTAIYPEATS